MLEELNKEFTFPFPPHDFQVKAAEELTQRNCSLLKLKVGLGKSFCSVLAALHLSLSEDVEQIIIICPPILIFQWAEFLQSIGGIPDVLVYQGSPAERAEMNLDAAVVIVSYNIFRGSKKHTADHKRFQKLAKLRKLCIIADELSLKNLQSQTYRKLKMLMYGKMRTKEGDKANHYLISLNATPISDLGQIYNWLSMKAPGVYPSLRLFQFAHVENSDHWGNVTEWKNTELMNSNLEIVSVDTDKEVVLPPLIETVVPYELEKKHLTLYKKVAAAMLEDLPDDKIELAVNSLFSTLQRLALAPIEFGLDVRSPVLDFVEGYMDQMQPEDGLLIYTRHKLISKMLSEKIPDCVSIYGDIPKPARVKAFEQLKSGKVRRLVGNLDSIGHGLNLQMLNHIIYIELPFRDDKLVQSTGRIHRQGQASTCYVNIPLAKGTIQHQIYHKLLKNGEDLSKVMRSKESVIEFLA